MVHRADVEELFEKLPPLLRLYAWVVMFVSVLWLLLQDRPRVFLMPFAAMLASVALWKLDDTFFEWPEDDDLGKSTPPLGVLVFTMCGRWVALFVWFRVSLALVGEEASRQSAIPLLLLCYALAATPIPLAGFPIAPAMEIGAHLAIFLSLLLIAVIDNARFAAGVLFFLVGIAALAYTVRDIRERERG